jgi:hypothetical protein
LQYPLNFRFHIALLSPLSFVPIELSFRELASPFLYKLFEAVRSARPDIFGTGSALCAPPSVPSLSASVTGHALQPRLFKILEGQSRLAGRLVVNQCLFISPPLHQVIFPDQLGPQLDVTR